MLVLKRWWTSASALTRGRIAQVGVERGRSAPAAAGPCSTMVRVERLGDVEALASRRFFASRTSFSTRLADDVQLALEGVALSLTPRPGADEHLRGSPAWTTRASGPSCCGSTRYVAPAEDVVGPARARALLEHLQRTALRSSRSRGRKTMPTPYSPSRRQREAELLAGVGEEVVRDLHQDARAVAGSRVAAAGAAVLEVAQDLRGPSRRCRATSSPRMLTTKPTPQASRCSRLPTRSLGPEPPSHRVKPPEVL